MFSENEMGLITGADAGVSDYQTTNFRNGIADVGYGAVAIGASTIMGLANGVSSLLTGDDIASTSSILRRAGLDNAATFAVQHDTLTEMGGLIGGFVSGGGLAVMGLKAMKAAGKRTGTGVWLHPEMAQQELMGLAAQVGRNTQQFKEARRAMMLKTLGGSVVEGAAAETVGALVTMGNPLMDDYEGTDWVIGAALGGAIGSVSMMYRKRKLEKALDGVDKDIGEFLGDLNTLKARAEWSDGSKLVFQASGLGMIDEVESAFKNLANSEDPAQRALAGNVEIANRLQAYRAQAREEMLATVDKLVGNKDGKIKYEGAEGERSFEQAIKAAVEQGARNGENPFAHVERMEKFELKYIPKLVLAELGDASPLQISKASKLKKEHEELRLEYVKTRDAEKFGESLRKTGKYSEYGIKQVIQEADDYHTSAVFDRRSGGFISAEKALDRASYGDVGDLSPMFLGKGFKDIPPAVAHARLKLAMKSSPKFRDTDGSDAVEMLRYVAHSVARAGEEFKAADEFMIAGERVTSYEELKEIAGSQLLRLAREEIEAAGKYADPFTISAKYGLKDTNLSGERVFTKLVSNSDSVTFSVDDLLIAERNGVNEMMRPNLMQTSGVALKKNYTEVMQATNRLATQDALHTEIVGNVTTLMPDVEALGLVDEILGMWQLDAVKALHRNVADSEVGGAHVSRDFALRDLEDVGDAVATIGALQIKGMREMLNKVLPDAADAGEVVLKNDLTAAQASKAIAVLRTAAPKEGEFLDLVEHEGGMTLAIVRAGVDEAEIVEYILTSGVRQTPEILAPEVVEYLTKMQGIASKQLRMQNAVRSIQGIPEEKGIGLRLPARDLASKVTGYLIKENTGEVQLLVADTKEGLAGLLQQANAMNGVKAMDRHNAGVNLKWESQVELGLMKEADISRSRTSITHLDTDTPHATLQELQGMAARELEANYRRVIETGLDHVVQPLRRAGEARASLTKGQPGYEDGSAALNYEATPQAKLINTLLNRKQAAPVTNKIYDTVEAVVDNVLYKAQDATLAMANGIRGLQKGDVDGLVDVVSKNGVDNGLKVQNSLTLHETPEALRWKTSKMVAVGNNVAGIAALRFLEVAHGLLNVMSMPVTMLGEIRHVVNRGEALGDKQIGMFDAVKLMHDGVRAAFDTNNAEIMKYYASKGLIESTVHEVNENIAAASLHKSALVKLEEKGWFQKTTIVSDYSEKMVRSVAAGTAWVAFQRKFPGRSVEDSLPFVRTYIDRTMGNYNSSQRPAMFQGTIGSAVGLFQTYSVTLVQNMVRHLENGNVGSLSLMGGAQAGMFGMGSLPGFDAVTDVIASNFSDEHKTFETAIHESLGGADLPGGATAAELLMYGGPSAYTHTSFFTRGETTPRLPFNFAEGSPLPSIVPAGASPLTNLWKMTMDIWHGAKNGQDMDSTILEALQTQTLSRPLARGADMIQGYSVDGAGRTVDQFASPLEAAGTATFARLVGARPLKEQLLRQTLYQNSYYGSLDSSNRKYVTIALRQAARDNTLTDARAEELLEAYLKRGGTSEGFTAAVNDAIEFSSPETRMDFRKIIGADNPLNWILTSAL